MMEKPDIYIANDFNKPDYLYINNGNGTFKEDYCDLFRSPASFFSMGMDINDLNNDGFEDVFNLDMASERPGTSETAVCTKSELR